MGESNDTIVWISGATSGIGAALARNCPYNGARIINISRRAHDELESVVVDLTDPAAWSAAVMSFDKELARFKGRHAIFVHERVPPPSQFRGRGRTTRAVRGGHGQRRGADCSRRRILAGCSARSGARGRGRVGADVIGRAARLPYPALAVYGAGKAAMEQWVRSVRGHAHRGRGPWVIAVRPGFVDTPAARKDALLSTDDFRRRRPSPMRSLPASVCSTPMPPHTTYGWRSHRPVIVQFCSSEKPSARPVPDS